MSGTVVETVRGLQDAEAKGFDLHYQENQKQLPKLPISPLEDTLKRYLTKLEAILEPEEYEEAVKVCEYFKATEGPTLHQQLLEYAKGVSSFLEKHWYNSYLSFQEPIVCNVNPVFLLEDDLSITRQNCQILRASSLVSSAAEFIADLRNGELDCDTWRTSPMCMLQYKYLFGSARLPVASSKDEMDTTTTCETSTHIIILCRGQFYWMDILNCDESGKFHNISTPALLGRAFAAILSEAEKATDVDVSANALCIGTAENRKSWGTTRSLLEQLSPQNMEQLKVVDEALFVLCLDSAKPETTSEAVANMLHGTYSLKEKQAVQVGTLLNRWYDKLQLIICANGRAGINFEHTLVDGHTVLRFAGDIFTDTITKFAKSINKKISSLFEKEVVKTKDPGTLSSFVKAARMVPRKLEWVMNDEILNRLSMAEMKAGDLIHQTEVCVEEFAGYGKQGIISKLRASPDAVVQIAILTAYVRLYKETPNIYESVQTKRFLHGRTEVCRTATPTAVLFANALGKEDSTRALELLQEALKVQCNQVRECAEALGPERQLFAMRALWWQKNGRARSRRPTVFDADETKPTGPEQQVKDVSAKSTTNVKEPGIFRQTGWSTLNNSIISTSNCGNPSLKCFGFGPTCPEGFGIGYIIRDDNITFTVTSKRRQTERLARHISKVLIDIMSLIEQVNGGDAIEVESQEIRKLPGNPIPMDML